MLFNSPNVYVQILRKKTKSDGQKAQNNKKIVKTSIRFHTYRTFQTYIFHEFSEQKGFIFFGQYNTKTANVS